jgi:EPS-associated MarR family transcriptional regulator
VQYRLLKFVAEHPHASQRELARELGVSLGKANYCIRALIDKGWVKLRNFKNSERKSAYAYVLTPSGIEEKANVTLAFLRRKTVEYDELARQLESLREEVRALAGSGSEAPSEP